MATAPASAPAKAGSPAATLPDGYVVGVEIAADDETRAQGLMYRDRLPEDHGMLFLFGSPGRYPFWMKNTIIPLDMIWTDADHRVVFVASDVPPCRSDPCPSYGAGDRDSVCVLETAAGVARKHGVVAGTQLRFAGLEHVIVR